MLDFENPHEKCRNKAVKYVALTRKTEGQVRDYLKRKEFSSEDIDDAIEFLREYDYVNDYRYAQNFFKEEAPKLKGRNRIERDLAAKKIHFDIIKRALDELLDESNPEYEELLKEIGTEKERALKLGQKMLKIQLEDGKEVDKSFLARVGRRLMAYGYKTDQVYYVIGELINGKPIR